MVSTEVSGPSVHRYILVVDHQLETDVNDEYKKPPKDTAHNFSKAAFIWPLEDIARIADKLESDEYLVASWARVDVERLDSFLNETDPPRSLSASQVYLHHSEFCHPFVPLDSVYQSLVADLGVECNSYETMDKPSDMMLAARYFQFNMSTSEQDVTSSPSEMPQLAQDTIDIENATVRVFSAYENGEMLVLLPIVFQFLGPQFVYGSLRGSNKRKAVNAGTLSLSPDQDPAEIHPILAARKTLETYAQAWILADTIHKRRRLEPFITEPNETNKKNETNEINETTMEPQPPTAHPDE